MGPNGLSAGMASVRNGYGFRWYLAGLFISFVLSVLAVLLYLARASLLGADYLEGMELLILGTEDK